MACRRWVAADAGEEKVMELKIGGKKFIGKNHQDMEKT